MNAGHCTRPELTQRRYSHVKTADAIDAASRIRLARIVTPERLRVEQPSLVPPANVPPFVVQTSLPDDVLVDLERRVEQLSPTFTLLPLPSGPMLAVATVQAGGLQLRTAVPLVDLPAYAWLDSCVARSEFAWLVERNERGPAVLLSTYFLFANVSELREVLAQARTPKPEELVYDLARACGRLTQAEASSTCASGTAVVKQVHLAMVWRALRRPDVQAAIHAALESLPPVH